MAGPKAAVAAAEAEGLTPRRIFGVGPAEIAVFAAGSDAWTDAAAKAVPEFAKIGRRMFSGAAPQINLFLFSDPERFRSFTRAALGEERSAGTGNFHLVAICLRCESRRADDPETVAVVLHEFSHAWMNTYLRERYRVDYLSRTVRRPFLDEGMADVVAGLWDTHFLARRRRMLKDRIRRGSAPPRLEDLRSESAFYGKDDRDTRYWFAALLAERMLGPGAGALPKLRRYLDLVGRGEDPERAWEKATSKSLRVEHAALVRSLWR
ncbi:MAG: hypothetical protein HY059_22140 [Proteobacteria bacterium]|nr:hypothetical protein [Pseudomonadota bacterium]